MDIGAEKVNKDKPSIPRSGKVAVGHPVDVASGTLFHTFNDYTLPGRMPIAFDRRYSTGLLNRDTPGILGKGWSSPFEVTFSRVDNGFVYIDESGEDEVSFALTESGVVSAQPILDAGSFADLTADDKEYCVTRWDPDSGRVTRDYFRKRDNEQFPIKLTRREDGSSNAIEFRYAKGSGLLEFILQTREQRGFHLLYDKANRLVEVRRKSRQGTEAQKKDDNKPWLTYQYNSVGMLATFTDPSGKQSHYKYDTDGRMISETTLAGKEWRFVFDEQGRCVVTTSKNKFDYHKLQYSNKGRLTKVEDSYGNVTQYHHNEAGQVLKKVSPLGHAAITVFDAFGRVIQEVTPAGNATTYAYDDAGNRCSITFADGASVLYVFNDRHLPISLTDPAGSTWQRSYDESGRTTSQVNPLGANQHYTYNKAGDIISHSDPENNTRQFQWDGFGSLTSVSDWEGNTSSYTWDRFGGLSSIQDPQGHTTSIRRDLLGRVSELVLADGNKRQYQWDVFDNITQYTDERNLKTQWQYCDCGNLEIESRADGSSIHFGWNAIPGQLAAVTNQENEVFHFSYDADGRLIEEQNFAGQITRYEYDADGRVIKTIKPSGKEIIFDYGTSNQITRISYSGGDETNFSYDARGLLLKADNGQCPVAFEYDNLGRLVREVQGNHEIVNEYNLLDQRITRRTDQEETTTFDWTPNGQIRQVQSLGFEPVIFDYDERGFETVRSFASVALQSNVNERGLLFSQTLKNGQNKQINARTYDYDAAGNLTKKSDDKWGTTSYVYDDLERITQTLHPDKTIENFSYDRADNIKSYARKLASDSSLDPQETWVYEKGSRLVKKGEATFTYDEDGQLVIRKNKDGKTEFTWNDAGQLVSVKTSEGAVWNYVYDALGRRVAKEGPEEKREFHWDGDVVLSEFKRKGDLIYKERWEYHPHNFSPLFKVQDKNKYLCVNDQVGSPMELVDRTGLIVWSLRNWTFGEAKESIEGSVRCDIRFRGQWFDEETSLCYNRFRYYEPNIGRYISSDPIGLIGGINLYKYAPNAVGWIDPYGLANKPCKGMSEAEKDDLAAAREELGLPPHSGPDDPHTVAILYADGERFVGVNAHGTDVSFPVNAQSRTHAEIDALNQLAAHRNQTGVSGGTARMVVDKAACDACGLRGGIGSGVRGSSLNSLEVASPGVPQVVSAEKGSSWLQ